MRPELLQKRAVELLKSGSLLEDVKVINSMPDIRLTVVKQCPVIAVGIDSARLYPIGIGEEDYLGDVALYMYIFIPYAFKSALASDILSRALSVLNCMNISSVSADKITSDKQTSCYVLRACIRFNNAYEMGGDGGEG